MTSLKLRVIIPGITSRCKALISAVKELKSNESDRVTDIVSGFHYGLSCFRMAEKIWSWQRIIKGITNDDFVSDQHKTFF